MCGRYGRRSDKQRIAEAFGVKSDLSHISMPPDDYNIAPSTFQPVILHQRDYDRWLSREATDQPPVDLMRPFKSEDMEVNAANPLVGNVRKNGPQMLNSA